VRRRAGCDQPDLEQPFRLGDHPQPTLLTDHHETRGDPVRDLVRGAVIAADLLVGDQLQTQGVRQDGRQFAEDLGEHQCRHFHVLGAAAVQPIALPPGPELVRGAGDDVEMSVQDDPEIRPGRASVEQGARFAVRAEPLDRDARPGPLDDEAEGFRQLVRTVRGGGDRDQFRCPAEQVVLIHGDSGRRKQVITYPRVGGWHRPG
jgi:hypothetical protein